jgi:hypothetical protein
MPYDLINEASNEATARASSKTNFPARLLVLPARLTLFSSASKLEMSASEADVSLPPDKKIEQGLRTVIVRLFKAAKFEELTVKRIRNTTENELELPENFFRTHDDWKDRSKDFITDEVVRRAESCTNSSYIQTNARDAEETRRRQGGNKFSRKNQAQTQTYQEVRSPNQ